MSRTKVQLVGDVNGGANFTGIVTATSANVGSGITLSGTQINVGSATTIHSTGFRIGSSDLHSSGLSIDNLNSSGIGTFNNINFTGTLNQNGSPFVASRWTTGIGDDIYRLSGDVGIGTTNPIGQLQISSGPLIVGAATSTGTASQTLQVTGGAYVSGNVGIGTTISSENGLSVLPRIQILNNSNSDGRLILRAKPGNAYRWNIDNDGSTNVFRIFREDDATAANGSVAVSISTTGTLTATTLVETSSITLKENINPIVNALDKVVQLNPVTYDRKSGESKNEAGLIAEEVNDIIPNIVSKDDEGNPNGINYTKLSVYLIDAIKELKKQIDELKG